MVKVQLITRTFIESISEELKINLNNDYDFYQNLSNHLGSIFRTGISDLQSNSFLDEVVIKNPDIVLAVKKHIEIILLDKAELIIEAGLNAQKQFAKNVLSGLTEEEKQVCINIFDKICNNAEEHLRNYKENANEK